MERKIYLLQIWKLLILGCICFFTACEDENALEPSVYIEETRFEFPQGKNDWDREIQRIQEKMGVYVIYKDFQVKDFNRGWVIQQTSQAFVGTDLTDAQVPFYFNFIMDNFFQFLDNDFSKQILPRYFYLVNDLHAEKGGNRLYDVEDKYDGLDFWATSFTDEKIAKLTDIEIKQKRNRIMYNFILKGVEKGIISEPLGFTDGINYRDKLSNDPENKDYFLNRGFVHYVKEDFAYDNPVNDLGVFTTKNADFLSYVRQILFETPEKFQAKYPVSKYTLINKRYQQVLSHFKTEYALDLNAVAVGPLN